MTQHHICRNALLLSILLLSISLSACSKIKDHPVINNLSPSPLPTTSPTTKGNDLQSSPTPSVPDVGSQDPSITAAPEAGITPPLKTGVKLSVRGVNISLGEGKDSLLNKLGYPNRIDPTEYDFDYYIYNNDYKRLLFVAVKDDKVVGFYSDSKDFNFLGIHSGSSLLTVNQAFGQNFSMSKVLTYKTDTYKARVLMDKLDTQKVTGIYVLSNSVKKGKYTKEVMSSVELMVYDLTNSIRARNKRAVLSWSSSAALSARKHSIDMAKNDYFGHINLIGRNPEERLMQEGIYYSICNENIIAGYGTAILSVHGWFNSADHRHNILSSECRYTGVGFYHYYKSSYKTYITQIYYR